VPNAEYTRFISRYIYRTSIAAPDALAIKLRAWKDFDKQFANSNYEGPVADQTVYLLIHS